MFKIFKTIALLIIDLLNSDYLRKLFISNVNVLLTDDEIVQQVVAGYDNKQLVTILMTNKKLYVLGDEVIHEVEKSHINEMVLTNGKLSKLIELISVNDEFAFFKVFTKRAIRRIEDWLYS